MDKPYKSFDEQIEILQKRGLSTNEKTQIILMQEGYYSVINGYKDLFIDKEKKSAASGEDRYKEGVKFDHIYRLFEFDRNLRVLMMRYLAIAEASLKTTCAYCFCGRYDKVEESYLRKDFYRSDRGYSHRIDLLIGDFKKVLGRVKGNDNSHTREYIEHYINNHDECPLWVLFNTMSFGTVHKFFSYQKESMRNVIARHFSDLYSKTHDDMKRFNDIGLLLAYDHIKEFRNICAHDERLFSAKVSPAKDISFVALMNDLSLVLPQTEALRMRIDVADLAINVLEDVESLDVDEFLSAMGCENVRALFGTM